MNPRVKNVRPGENYTLHLIFDNGEEGVFDVSPYLSKGIFAQLKDSSIFNSVKPFLGSIQWVNGLDLCPDTLYLDSIRHIPEKRKANPIRQSPKSKILNKESTERIVLT